MLGNDPVDACPQYSEEDETFLDPGDDEQAGPSLVIGPLATDSVCLCPNERILTTELTTLRNRVPTNTVVLVGEQKAGKTTLLACLYGMLCKGPVGDYSFVASKTLRAFAERHHLALSKTRRSTPTTYRTSRAENVGFFHLCLTSGSNTIDLVISDRSGEDFDDARVNTALITELRELTLADRVCFLLDAAKLTNVKTRANYQRTFSQLIRALIDNHAVPARAKIEVLVTKLDKISHPGSDPALLEAVRGYEKELLEEFKAHWPEFEIYEICALPSDNHSIGFVGLPELVARWCASPNSIDTRPTPVADSLRQFDLLLGRWGQL